MKKAVSYLVILFMFITCLSVSVKAQERKLANWDKSVIECKTTSEYELILDEIDKYETKMVNSALNIKDVEKYVELLKIKSDYIDYIYKLKETPLAELINNNFTNEQISAMKNFDGSDEMAIKASAYVSISAGSLEATEDLHGVRFSWTWFGRPALSGVFIHDKIAVRWQAYNEKSMYIGSEGNRKTNVLVRYGNTREEIDYVSQYDNSVEAEFALDGYDNGKIEFAKSGYFDVYVEPLLNSNTNISGVEFEFFYTHAIFEDIGISSNFPAGIGINVDLGEEISYKTYTTRA